MSRIVRGSGNVFADLGLPGARDHAAKADVVMEIHKALKRTSLDVACKRASIDPPELARVLRGHFRAYSMEKLQDILRCIQC